MHSLSMVGVKQEECGMLFTDLLKEIEKSPFMRLLMPWGSSSSTPMGDPSESDDGPIYWVRPGEQVRHGFMK